MPTVKITEFLGETTEFETQPTPLFGDLSVAEPMVLELMGPFAPVLQTNAATTQAPIPIAMHSVLAAAAVATQPFADVQTLSGYSPLSLFLITVAGSGERKSTCDKLACGPLRRVEAEKRRKYKERQRRGGAHDDVGDVIETSVSHLPNYDDGQSDLNPKIIYSDVTIEGLAYQLQNNQPSIGLISDEGGQFLGGYSMTAANSVGSAARLSKFWDAGQFDLIRASADPVELDGRRISLHMMGQPKIAGLGVGKQTAITVVREGNERTIKIETAKREDQEMVARKEPESSGKLGLRVRDLDAELASRLGYGEGEKGVLIIEVQSGSKAEKAGIQQGDLIKEINRKPVSNVSEFGEHMDKIKKGDTVRLLMKRGQSGFVAVKLTK